MLLTWSLYAEQNIIGTVFSSCIPYSFFPWRGGRRGGLADLLLAGCLITDHASLARPGKKGTWGCGVRGEARERPTR